MNCILFLLASVPCFSLACKVCNTSSISEALPSVALKAYVRGSHGHGWVELRYLLRHLLHTVRTCKWVTIRSGWFESSWSKRHMLTRADVQDSDRHCRFVRRPLTMPSQEHLVSTRFVLTFLLYLACRGGGARQPKAAAMLTEIFVASIGRVPKGVRLTTMVPTPGGQRMCCEVRVSLADNGTTVVVDGSVEVLCALGSMSKTNELVQFLKCCYQAQDGGVQVTAVAMLVLGLAGVVGNWFGGSGKQSTMQTEDVATLMPRWPSNKRYQRVDPGTKLMCSMVRYDRSEERPSPAS